MDLSLNKPRPSIAKPTSTILSSNPAPRGGLTGVATTAATAISATATVLSPGSIFTSAPGMVGGQQILHVIHTIPSVNVPSSMGMGMGMGQLQTIPVVVQSLPVVYTAVPTAAAASASAADSSNNVSAAATAAITVPLIGSDGRSEGSGETRGRGEVLRSVCEDVCVGVCLCVCLIYLLSCQVNTSGQYTFKTNNHPTSDK